MVRWEEEGGLDRLFRSPRVPAPPAAGTCSHVTTPRAASSARARHSRANMWLSGCNARCRSPPFEDAWAVLAATLGVSDSALGCHDQSGTHGSDGEAPRPISHRAYQCECSRQVRGLLQPAPSRPARPPVHPPPEPRACPLYQLDLRRGHLRSEPALPVVVVKGAAAFVALRLLLVSRCSVKRADNAPST